MSDDPPEFQAQTVCSAKICFLHISGEKKNGHTSQNPAWTLTDTEVFCDPFNCPRGEKPGQRHEKKLRLEIVNPSRLHKL